MSLSQVTKSTPLPQVTKSTSSVRTGFQCPGALPTAAEDATPTPPSTPPTPLNGVPTLPISPFTPIPPAILRIKENNKRKISPLCKIKELGDSCDCKECDVEPHPCPLKRCFLCKFRTPHDDKDCCLKCGNKFVEDFFPTELYPVERTPIQSVQELVQGVPPTFVHLDPKNSRKRYCNYCKRISLYLPKEYYLQCQGCHDMIPQDDFNKKKEEEVIIVKVEKRSPYFNHRQDCSSYLKKDLTYCDCRKPTKCDNCVKRGCDTECDCSVCGDTPQTPPFIKQEKKSSPPPAPKKQRTQGKLLLLVHHEKKPLTLVYRNNAFSCQPRR